MHPEELQEDLKSEVALILLEHNEDKIIQIYKTGGLKFYAVRIILNLVQSKTSPFFKKYRQYSNELEDKMAYIKPEEEKEETDFRLLKELREKRVMDAIEGLYWYDKEILKLYIKFGNYRDIEKETGIRWQSCYDTVQAAIGQIRYQFRKNNYATTI
jgi:hypothetical protein